MVLHEVTIDESEMPEESKRKTPRERFQKLAPKRVQGVLDRIRLLARCGNRQTYRYEQWEVDAMFDAIEKELQRARSRFEDENSTEFTFELPKRSDGE